MNGIYLEIDPTDEYLDLMLMPSEIEGRLEEKSIMSFVKSSEYNTFYIFEEAIAAAVATFKNAQRVDTSDPITERIGERRDAQVNFRLSEDEMRVNLVITSAWAGKQASVKALQTQAKKLGIVRGLSKKKLVEMADEARKSPPGTVLDDVVAMGLPARNGKNSRVKALVENALERILKPKEKDGRVDMRDLGDIICVKAGTPVARRAQPTEGRKGYTVTGTPLEPVAGTWVSFKPGSGTEISPDDENLLIAEINGMPKFKQDRMWVDDTFICKGVNVGTGNVNYDGAVLVNGDVTEKMQIIATGDITINGFVESAFIQAGGDIIITEGATGKHQEASDDYSTILEAGGSVHVAHGQGLDIRCNGNVTVGRQLAYSKINCRGTVTAGPINNPNGNLFACKIECYGKISAGTLGAVSGSALSIDFSGGFNQLMEKKDQLDELWLQLQQNNKSHEDKINFIKSKKIPRQLADRVNEAIHLFNNEKKTLEWLQEKIIEIKKAKEEYVEVIGLEAKNKIYPGVVVRLNNRSWKADREYPRARIKYEGHQWMYDPNTR
ncbi:DUF342 domain-containing protein [Planctobacterium marinum]|uniref:DUF342 domain-containing protein n=1 Tax=Planctobacterium marinum TaxID=1631968 RepID=UPI001E65A204|nr:FapA family protein [Planctobacterium marinum]MCC2604391.1 FapA family protein [Planctobacterium marinum]